MADEESVTGWLGLFEDLDDDRWSGKKVRMLVPPRLMRDVRSPACMATRPFGLK